jgi:hypothetical protein
MEFARVLEDFNQTMAQLPDKERREVIKALLRWNPKLDRLLAITPAIGIGVKTK